MEALGGGILPVQELDRCLVHTCPITLPLIFVPNCSYKRHTQRNTHFSALLDASAPTLLVAPPLSLSPNACLLLFISGSLLVLMPAADTATVAASTRSAKLKSTSACCAAAVGQSGQKRRKCSAWPKTSLVASCSAAHGCAPLTPCLLRPQRFCFGSIMVLFLIACQV